MNETHPVPDTLDEFTGCLVHEDGTETERVAWTNLHFNVSKRVIEGNDLVWHPPAGKYRGFRLYGPPGRNTIWGDTTKPFENFNDGVRVTITGLYLMVTAPYDHTTEVVHHGR